MSFATCHGQVWFNNVLFLSKNILICSSVFLFLCQATWHENYWALGAASSVGYYGNSEIQTASWIHLLGLMNLSLPLFPQD